MGLSRASARFAVLSKRRDGCLLGRSVTESPEKLPGHHEIIDSFIIEYDDDTSCAPDSAEGTGSSGLLVFPVLSGPLPHPCAQGGGGGRGLRLTVHRWASSLSSSYSEFFVEKWSTKSSITRFSGTW